jgi:hypothetical protein
MNTLGFLIVILFPLNLTMLQYLLSHRFPPQPRGHEHAKFSHEFKVQLPPLQGFTRQGSSVSQFNPTNPLGHSQTKFVKSFGSFVQLAPFRQGLLLQPVSDSQLMPVNPFWQKHVDEFESKGFSWH